MVTRSPELLTTAISPGLNMDPSLRRDEGLDDVALRDLPVLDSKAALELAAFPREDGVDPAHDLRGDLGHHVVVGVARPRRAPREVLELDVLLVVVGVGKSL